MTSKDLPTYRKVIENAVRNFSPDIKDHILKELDLEKRNGSVQFEERLKEILGQDKAESLLKEIKANKNEITNDEKEDLQNMFKDSLTFD
jgi:predicted flavoprotein YhiN